MLKKEALARAVSTIVAFYEKRNVVLCYNLTKSVYFGIAGRRTV